MFFLLSLKENEILSFVLKKKKMEQYYLEIGQPLSGN
jgi:hypothetical protein